MSRIITISGPGTAPRLAHAEVGEPGPGEVRVRLHAAALNFADLLMAEGKYQDTPPFPFVAGLEGAGVIEAVGAGVPLRPGTRVTVAAQGTLADHGIFPAEDCVPIPDCMSWRDAAGFSVAYGTSHLALTGPARLRSGETLAVLGAGGGVGLTAVEIGAALGARVIAVARGADKLDAARRAGAADTIDSGATDDLRAALRHLGGVDVVYDAVGDAPGLAAFGALRPGGRYLVIGFAGGRPPVLPLNHALVKNIAILGFYWGGYRKLDRQAMRDSLESALRMYADGRLRPTAGAVLSLDRAPEGYDLLRQRKAVGKVILTMTDEAAHS